MNSFKNRIIRAAMLDVNLYEEVEADKKAMGQAMGVVILSSVAAGVGLIEKGGLSGILPGTIASLFGGISGHILLTLLARNFSRSHKPRLIMENCYVLLVFRALPD